MFYTLVGVHTYDLTWDTEGDVDAIGDMPIEDIYAAYQGCVLVLERPNVNNTFYLDLFLGHSIVDDPTLTVREWLQTISAEALPTTIEEPYETFKYVTYTDAYRANYQTKPIPGDRHPDQLVTEGERTDMLIWSEGRDPVAMSRYCMVSVNGLFHLVKPEAEGLRVRGGWTTCRVSNEQFVGIYSFLSLGAIEYVPITAEMVRRDESTVPLRFKANIDPNMDLTNKTVFLVLGGYLHALDSLYTVEDSVVKIDLARYRLATRLYDGLRKTTYEGVTRSMRYSPTRPVAKAIMNSDEFYTAYLTDPNTSFLVVLENSSVFSEIQPVENTHLASTYLSPKTIHYPLISNIGRAAEYIPLEDDEGRVVLRCPDTHFANFVHESSDLSKMTTVDGSLNPGKPWSRADAHYLKIYTRTITADPNGEERIDGGDLVLTPDRPEGVELLLVAGAGGGFMAVNGPTVHTWGSGTGHGWMTSKAVDGDAGFDLVYAHDPKYPNDVKKVSGGYSEGTLVLRQDGSLFQVAGTGYSLPFGSTGNKDISVSSAANKHAHVIDKDGGLISSYTIGASIDPMPEQMTSGLELVASGYYDVATVDDSGNVWVWGVKTVDVSAVGPRGYGATNRIPWDLGGAKIVQILSKVIGGSWGYTALDDQGRIWCDYPDRWGTRTSGMWAGIPAWAQDLNVRHIIETRSSIWGIITQDDEVYFWGTRTNESNPSINNVPVDIQGKVLACVANVVTDGSAAVALLKDGTFRSWGDTDIGSGPTRPATWASGHGTLRIDVTDYL